MGFLDIRFYGVLDIRISTLSIRFYCLCRFAVKFCLDSSAHLFRFVVRIDVHCCQNSYFNKQFDVFCGNIFLFY